MAGHGGPRPGGLGFLFVPNLVAAGATSRSSFLGLLLLLLFIDYLVSISFFPFFGGGEVLFGGVFLIRILCVAAVGFLVETVKEKEAEDGI